jgi:hypothetical protein
MNIVDTAHGRRDVTVPGWQNAPGAVGQKTPEVGDIVAVPFEGYGDILCEVTEASTNALGDLELTASDGRYSYTLIVSPAPATVNVYPDSMKGTVQR